ncbi:MAG: tetratricopeptide repeat protein [Candidatus Coatesbacteria bacterium]|nr:MAG: tetratricopeptide repeat protein [Candidatus Coatesbacteria bacterium]
MKKLSVYLVACIVVLATFAFVGCGGKEELDEEEGAFEDYEEDVAGGPEYEGETAVVSAGPLNLRSRPSLGGAVVQQLDVGDSLVVLDRSDEQETIDNVTDYWYNVRTDDGDEGWVFGAYINVGGEPTTAGEPVERAKEIDISVTAADEPGWGAADYFAEGKKLHDAGRYNEALPYLKRAVELEPEKGDYHFYLAFSLQELGRNAEAASEYEECIEYKPNDFWAHNNLGLACIHSGQPARAIEVLDKAITLDPAGTTDKEGARDIARRNLAAAYEMNGQPGKANEIRDRFNL